MTTGEVPGLAAGGQLVTAVLDEQSSVIELAVSGVWDRDLRLRAVAAMTKCLASHPAGLVVDLEHLEDPRSASAGLWFTLRGQAQRMVPPVPVVVCVRGVAPLAVTLHRRGARYRLPIFGDLALARAALAGRGPLTDQVRLDLPPLLKSVGVARQLVAAVCPEWDLLGVVSRAQLVASELVLNAVQYAGTDIEFTVTRLGPPLTALVRRESSCLHLAVHDLDPRLPPLPHGLPPQLNPRDGRGQGLHLVDAAADGWGALPTRRGKQVWAVLRGR